MNKKARLASVLYFVLGLLLGAVPALIYASNVAGEKEYAKALAFSSSSEMATYAYQFAVNSEAVDRIQKFLDTMDWEQKHGGNAYVNFPINKALAYGQLAQLYRNLGQTNMSETCVSEALENAKESGFVNWVTNEARLKEWVGRYPPRMVTP